MKKRYFTILAAFITGVATNIYASEDLMVSPTSTTALTDLQRHVVLEDGTEPPFNNEYWDNKRAGIYVDIQNGQPLFSSIHKFKSGTGWPSFTQPIAGEALTEKVDRGFFTTRTEVRSAQADSHLGHVFPDGPQEAGGLRYCINSASLRFIPVDELDAQGYGEYAKMFDISSD